MAGLDAPSSQPVQRLYYLDNLRVFCMIFGVFFHAQFMSDLGLWGDVFATSPYFRMQLFFWISGFFAALLLSRRSVKTFYGTRLMVLGVPMLTGLFLLNPTAIYLKRGFVDGVPYGSYMFLEALDYVHRVEPGGVFLHLWFLGVLGVFVCAAPLISRAIKGLVPYSEQWSLFMTPLILGLGMAMYWVVFRASFRIFDCS